MAKCAKCGAEQGCSCQLTNGLCPGCYSASLQATNPNTQPPQVNASPQTK
jgi:NMD protein affecting ribosome stability and mRNA decay